MSNDLKILILIAGARFLVHLLTSGEYGFHRDELATIDDARHLAWGYVAYPPVAPLIARLGMELFGATLFGVRFFSAFAQAIVVVISGLMARALGGTRFAQIATALAVASAPISMLMGVVFQYVSFDYLWWVLIAYFVIQLQRSENPRWWLAIGAAIGMGMMTKYTIAVLVAGLVAGVLLTPVRRHLTGRWLWTGVVLSLLLFLPNLLWQVQHNFISLDFLSSIHERDIRIGRTEGYVIEQLFVSASPLTIPLWLAGLYFYFFTAAGRRYRILGWMYLVPFLLFLVMQGRSYYLAPAYPMLLAGGAVAGEMWLSQLRPGPARGVRGAVWVALAISCLTSGALMLPIAPVNSPLWEITSEVHDNFVEQIGWPELVETVAEIYAGLPDEEQETTGILTGNYGEAGAINLYGPAYGLPRAISGVNSFWLRGYGDPPQQTLIVLGFSEEEARQFFERCEIAGQITNTYGVENEETKNHPLIFLCRTPRQPWPQLWPTLQRFG